MGASAAMEWKLGSVYPLIHGRLYFTVHADDAHTARVIQRETSLFLFSSFEHEKYRSYCSDFGPVDLESVADFCRDVRARMHDPRLAGRKLVYYCERDRALRTNAAWLLGAYLVLVAGWSPEDAARPFERIVPSPFLMFRDATGCTPTSGCPARQVRASAAAGTATATACAHSPTFILRSSARLWPFDCRLFAWAIKSSQRAMVATDAPIQPSCPRRQRRIMWPGLIWRHAGLI
jgi:hypothetical protein